MRTGRSNLGVNVVMAWYFSRAGRHVTMQRLHSSAISSEAGDILARVIDPTRDGWWDVAATRLEPNRGSLASPYLCNGDRRVPISLNELFIVAGYLPGRPAAFPEHSNIISWVLLMEGWAQVFWDRGGICLFGGLKGQHREVLRVVQQSMSSPRERESLGVSFTETILTLSDLYGCEGAHRRACPISGDRSRSLISADGSVKTSLVRDLRGFGLAADD